MSETNMNDPQSTQNPEPSRRNWLSSGKIGWILLGGYVAFVIYQTATGDPSAGGGCFMCPTPE